MANDLTVYDVPDLDADLAIDFLGSRDLAEIENGIRSIEATSNVLALVQGVAIVKVEREGLWAQAGFTSLWEYRRASSGRLNMAYSTVSTRRRIAEAWLDYKKLLQGIDLSGQVSKLRVFSQAVKRHGEKATLQHFKKDNYQDFHRFALPRPKTDQLPDVDVSVKEGTLYIEGTEALTVSDDLDKPEIAFIVGVLKSAYRARLGNLLPHVVAVYDKGEARAVDNFLKKYRAKL
jgi:hypothetical protein